MPDVIQLRGLRALGHHGALEAERSQAQPFRVDVDVEADLSSAATSDVLQDTIHYGELAQAIVNVVENESHQLLERLAQRIADEVMTHERATAVEVTVTKLRPPVPVDLAAAAVRLRRP